jgi:phage terminase large subunit
LPNLSTPEASAEALSPLDLARVFSSHERFAASILDEDYWLMQREIARAIDQHDLVAVKACHSSGKTRLAAGIGLSYLCRYPDAIVISTAPTWTQVEKLLWGEVKGLRRNMRHITLPEPLATELRIDEKNYFIGYSTNDAVRFQGWHSLHTLIILDEAPGVADPIWEAIEGIRAGGRVKVLALGNPVIGTGQFYRIFADSKLAKLWQRFTISAFDTPNLAGCYYDDGKVTLPMRAPSNDGRPPVNLADLALDDPFLDDNVRPYLTTRRWVREKIQTWGVDSPMFQSRVLGRFPGVSPDALIGLQWVEEAEEAHPGQDGEPIDVGIDVAGPGEDYTSLIARQGTNLYAHHRWPGDNVEGQVIQVLRMLHVRSGGLIRHIGVDDIGQGHSFGNAVQLGIRDVGLSVTPINVQWKCVTRDGRMLCADHKAERYWRLRDRFKERRMGNLRAAHEEIKGQLTGLRWGTNNRRGLIEITPKDELKKKFGLDSPDDAEALMLAEYFPELTEPRRRAVLPPSVSLPG